MENVLFSNNVLIFLNTNIKNKYIITTTSRTETLVFILKYITLPQSHFNASIMHCGGNSIN